METVLGDLLVIVTCFFMNVFGQLRKAGSVRQFLLVPCLLKYFPVDFQVKPTLQKYENPDIIEWSGCAQPPCADRLLFYNGFTSVSSLDKMR